MFKRSKKVMITRKPLKTSEIFETFYKESFYPIKADYMLILNEIEIYYSKKDEIIYIDDLNMMTKRGEDETIYKEELEELLKYLNWDNYILGLYPTSPDSSILCLKKR